MENVPNFFVAPLNHPFLGLAGFVSDEKVKSPSD